jgi:Uma2 family endonuclease
MSTAIDLTQLLPEEEGLLPLQPGDHLDQKTFHARYAAMPEHVRAELIGGVVYMPSPLKARHGRIHQVLNNWLTNYRMATPGTDVFDNTTTILGEQSEPQPDAYLTILPECGGQTREDDDGYVTGAPEFVAEVADSSASIDLHAKRRDYEQAGVREYLVLVLRQNRIVWFVRGDEGFTPLAPGDDGVYRSPLFGGLWLDADALLRGDMVRVNEVLQQGLASPEHAAFVDRLRQPSGDRNTP